MFIFIGRLTVQVLLLHVILEGMMGMVILPPNKIFLMTTVESSTLRLVI